MTGFRSLALAALLGVGGAAAIAQDSTEAPTETPQAAETPETDTDRPNEVIAEVHGDWQIRCQRDRPNDCFMFQLAVDQNNAPVAEFTVIALPEGRDAVAGVTVVTPLSSFLPKGVRLQVDSNQDRAYPFLWCSQIGCFVQFGLPDAGVAQYKRGATAKLRVVPNENREQVVELDISLTGFTAAFNDLSERRAKAQ